MLTGWARSHFRVRPCCDQGWCGRECRLWTHNSWLQGLPEDGLTTYDSVMMRKMAAQSHDSM